MNKYWCCPDCGMQFFSNEICQSNTNHYCNGKTVQVASPYNQQDKQEEVLNRIYSSLTRIEDMIYYYTHNLKQPD